MDRIGFDRLLDGVKITVVAERIERLALYGVTIRVNGVLYDMRHSDDPWLDARKIIEEAYAEAGEPQSVAIDR